MKLEMPLKKENKENHQYEFDAVFVLGANVKKLKSREGRKDQFVPTDYESPTEMGLAGGAIRIAASAELYLSKKARRFIFSGKQSPRAVRLYGDQIPFESEIYGSQFNKTLNNLKKRSDLVERFKDLDEVIIEQENNSINTQTQVKEFFNLIFKNKWENVAILTSEYHLLRTQAFYEGALKEHPEIKTHIVFLSAEKIMKDAYPGKYDETIDRAYISPDGIKRTTNETQGLADFKSGRYKPDPFKIDGSN